MDFWGPSEAAKPLTEEDLRRAMDAILNAPPHPCSLGKHVVSPKARYRPGIYICGYCGGPVEVPYPLSERA